MFAQLGVRGTSMIFSSGDFGVGGSTCANNDGSGTVRFQPMFPASCMKLPPCWFTTCLHVNCRPICNDRGYVFTIFKLRMGRRADLSLQAVLSTSARECWTDTKSFLWPNCSSTARLVLHSRAEGSRTTSPDQAINPSLYLGI